MDFFEVISKRRSVRRFTETPVPDDVITKALEAAHLAPNSSNTQTWNFIYIKSPEAKSKVAPICLNQSAARTAQALVVIVADYKLWSRSQPQLLKYVDTVKAPDAVKSYYSKLVPIMYTSGFLNIFAPIKWLLFNVPGLFRAVPRGPVTMRDSQEVAIKSAALAAENFVLALTAQGFASCMMEGFDEPRMKRLLRLPRSARVVMVVGVGQEAKDGTWGPRFRIPYDQVVTKL